MARKRTEEQEQDVVTSQSVSGDGLRNETDQERQEREQREREEAEETNQKVQSSDDKLVEQRQRNLYGRLDRRDTE